MNAFVRRERVRRLRTCDAALVAAGDAQFLDATVAVGDAQRLRAIVAGGDALLRPRDACGMRQAARRVRRAEGSVLAAARGGSDDEATAKGHQFVSTRSTSGALSQRV